MKRRTFLTTSAALVAASALSAIPAISTMPAFAQAAAGFEKKRANVLGHDMAYIDVGEGRPVVFLHGNPTSSFLWRNIIPYVSSSGHRAIAPDLMGMGDSDKPPMTDTYLESAAYLHSFLDSLDLQDVVLVIHDWGSALGWHYARTRSDRVSAICFMEAMTPAYLPIPSYESLGQFEPFLRTVNTPGAGEKLIMEDNYFLDQFLKHGSPNGPLGLEVMAEYNRYYPTVESRQILLDWPREIPVEGQPADVYAQVVANNEWLLQSDLPKLMFHVQPGAIIPQAAVESLRQSLKNLEVIDLGPGGHFLQEDHPDAIGRGLAEWLERV